MRKIICACLVLLTVCMAYTCANAQQKQKSTVVTYYPAPRADYKTIRLDPTNQPATASGAGQMYYNGTNDTIMYYNNVTWVPLGRGAAQSPTDHLPPKDEFGGTCSTGDVYYDNGTDAIVYLNKTRNWTVMAPDRYWAESALIPASGSDSAHYNVYLANQTIRRVGLGTRTPNVTLDVLINDSAGPSENFCNVNFGKVYPDKGTNADITFYLYPNGTSEENNSTLNSTASIYAYVGQKNYMKLAALNASGSISFNVGGYNTSNSEVMRLANPGGESNPTPRVGIGNSTPPFALYIDSDINCTSVFAVRQVEMQQAANWYKGGYWNMIPYADTLYLAYGLYCKSADDWYCDLFKLQTGAKNNGGSKIGISANSGIWMVQIGSYNAATGQKSSWVDPYPLFDERGIWNGASSRALKENFIPLDQDEILQKIDQLEVSRWNYISEGPSAKRMGPVAEDFYRLFKTGKSEKILQPSDSIGVSLAGVKALSGKINGQQQQLQELQAAIKDIRSQIGLRRGGLR